MKNSKIILIVMAIVCILCVGCENKETGKSVNDILNEYKYKTKCRYSVYSFSDNNDILKEHNMESWYSALDIAYDDLDDKVSVVHLYNKFEFNNWQKAKEYYDDNIEEWKETKQEAELSEENIDSESSGEITVTKLYKEKSTPRSIIEEQKEAGYTCKTTKSSDRND